MALASNSAGRVPDEGHPGRPPPPLSPQNVIRSIVLIQAAARRRIAIRHLQRYGHYSEDADKLPALSCAVSFCESLLRPDPFKFENEAMGVIGIICGRDARRPDLWGNVQGLTLGTLVAAYDYYEPKLYAGHPVLELIKERFKEVALDVEDDVMLQIQDAPIPSIARRRMQDLCKRWGAPALPLGGGGIDEYFPHADEFIKQLRENAEKAILEKLQLSDTRAAFDALAAAVERELGDIHTPSRNRVRQAQVRHRDHIQGAANNHYGWPPNGPSAKLSHAARLYANELGTNHVIIDDFGACAARIRLKTESKCELALAPLGAEVNRLRKLLNTVPPPPKLMAEGYTAELGDALKTAMKELLDWRDELGYDSDVFFKHMKSIMDAGPFLDKIREDAEAAAAELRRLGPAQDPVNILLETPESWLIVEERLTASTQIMQLLAPLRREGEGAYAEALGEEFAEELTWVKTLEAVIHAADDGDDGWHKPPGFDLVDVPYVKPESPPPTPPPPPRPPTPPQGGGKMKLKIRLHGVTLEDVQHHSEILLMEQCAGLIAAECKMPREWIDDIVVSGGLLDTMKNVDASHAASIVADEF